MFFKSRFSMFLNHCHSNGNSNSNQCHSDDNYGITTYSKYYCALHMFCTPFPQLLPALLVMTGFCILFQRSTIGFLELFYPYSRRTGDL